MKLKSLKFTNHSILGDLELDFTDRQGNIVDTIIFAGGNGCGKTTLLGEIFKLCLCQKDIAPDEEIEYTLLLEGHDSEIILKDQKDIDGLSLLTIKHCYNESLLDRFTLEGVGSKQNVLEINGLGAWNMMHTVQNLFRAIFSKVGIDYVANNIGSVTSSNVDEKPVTLLESEGNLSTTIKQLLIDIAHLDDGSVHQAAADNPDQSYNEYKDKLELKMDRFKRAFALMFDNLQYEKIENKDGYKEILFKRGEALIPIDALSSGEKQIVFRGSFILKDKKFMDGVIGLLDEPEISMHPEWQKKILEFYQKLFSNNEGKQTSQLFVATHSPFIIHNPTRMNDKVIILKRQKNGKVVALKDNPEYYNCSSSKVIEDSFNVAAYKDLNKPVLFVEDLAHYQIIEMLLQKQGIDMEIVPVGSCDKVSVVWEKVAKLNLMTCLCLLDGDRRSHKEKPQDDRVHRLKKYCIENYLLGEDILTDLLVKYEAKKDLAEIMNDIFQSLEDNRDFHPLAMRIKAGENYSWSELDCYDGSAIVDKLIKILAKKDKKAKKDLYAACIDIMEKREVFAEQFSEIL